MKKNQFATEKVATMSNIFQVTDGVFKGLFAIRRYQFPFRGDFSKEFLMKFCQISNVFFSRRFLQLQKIKFQPLKNLIVAKYHEIPIQNQKKI